MTATSSGRQALAPRSHHRKRSAAAAGLQLEAAPSKTNRTKDPRAWPSSLSRSRPNAAHGDPRRIRRGQQDIHDDQQRLARGLVEPQDLPGDRPSARSVLEGYGTELRGGGWRMTEAAKFKPKTVYVTTSPRRPRRCGRRSPHRSSPGNISGIAPSRSSRSAAAPSCCACRTAASTCKAKSSNTIRRADFR